MPSHGRVRLFKPIEYVRQELRGNTFASIDNAYFYLRIYLLQQKLNTPSFWCKLDGVIEEVPENLLKSIRITGNRSTEGVNYRLEANAFRQGARAHRVNRCG